MATQRERNPRGHGGRLRDDLVRAADKLLETTDGEEALSMRAVARQAGVAPQSVYLHFADKRELVAAVYDVRFGELVAVLDRAATGIDEPRERLLALAHAYLQYGAEHPGHYRVLFETAGTPTWEPDRMLGLQAFALLRATVTDLQAPRPDEATSALWAGLHGLVTLQRDRPSFPWPDIDTVVATLVGGVVGR